MLIISNCPLKFEAIRFEPENKIGIQFHSYFLNSKNCLKYFVNFHCRRSDALVLG